MIIVHKYGSQEIWNIAAEQLCSALRSRLKEGKKVSLFLSGGSSIKLYVRLTEWLRTVCLKPEQLVLAQVDERFKPENIMDINSEVIAGTGLWDACREKNISYNLISQDNDLVHSSDNYNRDVAQLFTGKYMRIAVLGIGQDCHTAGLLPGYENDWNTGKMVAGYKNNGLYCQRVTLTLKALKLMNHVFVAVVGDDKKNAILASLNAINTHNIGKYPAAVIQQVEKTDIYTDIPIGL
jgi:6-phosphogluconolactonase/glucosamine-6-phosphate isomerase/deaminase